MLKNLEQIIRDYAGPGWREINDRAEHLALHIKESLKMSNHLDTKYHVSFKPDGQYWSTDKGARIEIVRVEVFDTPEQVTDFLKNYDASLIKRVYIVHPNPEKKS